MFGSWRVLPNRRVLSTPAGCSFAWRTEQRQPSYTVHCLCICLFSQVCLLTVVVQHAVSGQGSQAAAVPSLWGQGTVVKICAPMYSCKPSSDLREPLERWQKVGGFSIPVRKTTNLLSLELMCSSVPFCMNICCTSLLLENHVVLLFCFYFGYNNRVGYMMWLFGFFEFQKIFFLVANAS